MQNQNVIHFAVLDVTRSVLELHGMAPAGLDDAVAAVNARIIERAEAGGPPQTVRAWQRLAARTAARYAVEERGLCLVDEAAHVDFERGELLDDEDEESLEASGPEQVLMLALFGTPEGGAETRHQIEVLLDMLRHGEMPEHGREILAGLGDGKKVPAIAAALGLTADDVRNRLRRMRALFFRRVVAVEEVTTGILEDAEDGGGGECETQDEDEDR